MVSEFERLQRSALQIVAASLRRGVRTHGDIAPCLQLLSRRKPVIQHQINKNPRHRNIEPDRHRPASQSAVSIPSALKHRNKSQNHQWQRDKREQNVRCKNWKIYRGNPAGITRRLFANLRVINHISDQKCGRGDDCRYHARYVSLPDLAPDVEPAGRYEDRAQQVESGINCRKIGYAHEVERGRVCATLNPTS